MVVCLKTHTLIDCILGAHYKSNDNTHKYAHKIGMHQNTTCIYRHMLPYHPSKHHSSAALPGLTLSPYVKNDASLARIPIVPVKKHALLTQDALPRMDMDRIPPNGCRDITNGGIILQLLRIV